MFSHPVHDFFRRLALLPVLFCTVLIGGFTVIPADLATAAVVANTTEAAEEKSQTNPHALMILTDGVNWNNISAASTPNLAAWAATGAMFNVVPPDFSGIYCPIDAALAYGVGKEITTESIAPLADCSVPKIQPRVGDTDWDYWFYRIQNFRNPPEHPDDTLGFFSGALDHAQIKSATIGDTAAAMMLNYSGNLPENHVGANFDNDFFSKQVTDALRLNQLTIVGASTTNFSESARREIRTREVLNPEFQTELTQDEIALRTEEFAQQQAQVNAQRVDRLLEKVPPGTLVMFISLMNLGDESALQPGFISTGPEISAKSVTPGGQAKNLDTSGNKQTEKPVSIPGATMLDVKVQQAGTVLFSSLLPTFFKLIGVDTAQYAKIYAQEHAAASIRLSNANITNQAPADAENAAGSSSLNSADEANENESSADVAASNTGDLSATETEISAESGAAGSETAAKNSQQHTESTAENAESTAAETLESRTELVLKQLSANTERLQFIGKNPRSCNPNSACFLQRRADLHDAALRSHAIDEVRGGFFKSIRLSTIGFLLLTSIIALITRFSKRAHSKQKVLAAFSGLWSIIGLTISSVLISSHILSLSTHWWRAENPALIMLGGSWALALGLSCSGYFIFRRFSAYAPALIIFGLTSILLLVEIATGSQHLIDAPIGFNTLAGARFYGLGNEGFAILASCWLIVLGFVPLLIALFSQRFQWKISAQNLQRISAVFVGIIGLFTLVVIAAPKMGADFGGAISFSAALLLLFFLIAQIRISWKKTLLLGFVGGFAAMGFAVLDWLRGPESRTHLGNFVQTLLDGDAGEIVIRKISVNLRLLTTSSHRFVVLAALIAVAVVIVPWFWQTRQNHSTPVMPLARDGSDSAAENLCSDANPSEQDPNISTESAMHNKTSSGGRIQNSQISLQHGLIAVGVCLLIAFAVNDSGIVLPGMGTIAVLPALLPVIQLTQQR